MSDNGQQVPEDAVQIDANVVIEKLRGKLAEADWRNTLLEVQLDQLRKQLKDAELTLSSA